MDATPASPAALGAGQDKLALAALVAGAIGIAFAPIFVRLSEVGPVATAFWRVLLALPLTALWAGVQRGQGGALERTGLAWIAAAGLFFAADLGVWHWSIQLTSVANSTFLVNLAPVLVTLGAWLMFRERARPVFFAGLLLALAGAALLVGATVQAHARALAGDLLALLTAVFYAGYQLSIKRARGSHATARIMLVSGAFCSAVLLPVAVAMGEALLPASSAGWLVLIGLAVVCQFGGQNLITYAVAHLPANFSSVSLLLQPVAASLFAWIFFGEALSGLQWLGGAAVLAGIYLAKQGSR